VIAPPDPGRVLSPRGHGRPPPLLAPFVLSKTTRALCVLQRRSGNGRDTGPGDLFMDADNLVLGLGQPARCLAKASPQFLCQNVQNCALFTQSITHLLALDRTNHAHGHHFRGAHDGCVPGSSRSRRDAPSPYVSPGRPGTMSGPSFALDLKNGVDHASGRFLCAGQHVDVGAVEGGNAVTGPRRDVCGVDTCR
jgi:hypothetical protein